MMDCLPHATWPPRDIILNDGAHAFPYPFIDWYFTAGALKTATRPQKGSSSPNAQRDSSHAPLVAICNGVSRIG
jgi:hypothetical protein